MEILKKTILLLFISTAFISCKDSGSPESITKLFLISLNKLDYVTANTIATKSTKKLLKIMEEQTAGIDEATKEKRGENFTVKIEKPKIVGDSIAYVSFSTNPELVPFKEIKLIKVIGTMDKESWKVDISSIDYYDVNQFKQQTNDTSNTVDGVTYPDADSIANPE